MIKDTIYRVIDTDGKTYSGWNNINGIYNSERAARLQVNRELKHRKANQEYRARIGQDPIEYGSFRIQKATIEWEDV